MTEDNRVANLALGIIIAGLVAALALTGAIIYGIISLANWITG